MGQAVTVNLSAVLERSKTQPAPKRFWIWLRCPFCGGKLNFQEFSRLYPAAFATYVINYWRCMSCVYEYAYEEACHPW